jgi:DNA-binding HxlR family transcriptional regulator
MATLPSSRAAFNSSHERFQSRSKRAPVAACFNLQTKSHLDNFPAVPRRSKPTRRSDCPVSVSLEIFGDRWSLLIVRDMMVRAFRTFKQFQESGEGIASNILSDRLRKLESAEIIVAEADLVDRRRMTYRLTEKGIDLAPVVLELLIWGARHEETDVPCAAIGAMAQNRGAILGEVRRRWAARDDRPLQVEGRWIWP